MSRFCGCARPLASEPPRVCVEESRFHREFALSRKLGRGSCGSVFAARRRASPDALCDLSVKVVDLRRAAGCAVDSSKALAADRELRALKALPVSDFVVRYIGDFREVGISYLVMEICETTVLDMLGQVATLNESTMKLVFKDMVEGLIACHDHCVVHRDVKPENFLAQPLANAGAFRVKLCDFGLAAVVSSPSACELRGMCGTAPYMAPEMLRSEAYSAKVDMWAMGATAYVLLFGEWPHQPAALTAEAIKASIAEGVHGPRYRSPCAQISDAAAAWVQELLDRNPQSRPSAQAALARRSFAEPWDASSGAPLRPVLNTACRRGLFNRVACEEAMAQLDTQVLDLNSKVGAGVGTVAELVLVPPNGDTPAGIPPSHPPVAVEPAQEDAHGEGAALRLAAVATEVKEWLATMCLQQSSSGVATLLKSAAAWFDNFALGPEVVCGLGGAPSWVAAFPVAEKIAGKPSPSSIVE